MWDIWINLLLPKALNGCPKCKKSPNLVTLEVTHRPIDTPPRSDENFMESSKNLKQS